MKRYQSVEEYLAAHAEWSEELNKLRKLLCSTELEETLKWSAPCYTLNGKNVVGLAAFKEHVALWFHQGVYLSDPQNVLVNAQEGSTKALRQWRFRSSSEIKVRSIKAYLLEAIENQKQGKELVPARGKAVALPAELKAAFAKQPKTKKAFAALSPGKQREFAQHIASAKRAETRLSRVQKALPLIEAGVGLHDKYRNC